MKQLVYQALVCPDGTVIESTHRHDYKHHTWEGGSAAIDGGLDYCRLSGDIQQCKHETVYTDEPFEKVRKYAFRLDHGLKPVRISQMSNDWLEKAIIYELTYKTSSSWHLLLLMQEKQYRIENEIFIDDEQ